MEEPPRDDLRDPEPPHEPGRGSRRVGIAFFLLAALWFFTSFFKDVF